MVITLSKAHLNTVIRSLNTELYSLHENISQKETELSDVISFYDLDNPY